MRLFSPSVACVSFLLALPLFAAASKVASFHAAVVTGASPVDLTSGQSSASGFVGAAWEFNLDTQTVVGKGLNPDLTPKSSALFSSCDIAYTGIAYLATGQNYVTAALALDTGLAPLTKLSTGSVSVDVLAVDPQTANHLIVADATKYTGAAFLSINAQTGAVKSVTPVISASQSCSAVTFCAASTYVAIACAAKGATRASLVIIPIRGGVPSVKERVFISLGYTVSFIACSPQGTFIAVASVYSPYVYTYPIPAKTDNKVLSSTKLNGGTPVWLTFDARNSSLLVETVNSKLPANVTDKGLGNLKHISVEVVPFTEEEGCDDQPLKTAFMYDSAGPGGPMLLNGSPYGIYLALVEGVAFHPFIKESLNFKLGPLSSNQVASLISLPSPFPSTILPFQPQAFCRKPFPPLPSYRSCTPASKAKQCMANGYCSPRYHLCFCYPPYVLNFGAQTCVL